MVARYALPPLRLDVQTLEPLGDGREARRRDGGAPLVGIPPAGLGVLGEAQNRRGRELGLLLDAVRLDERAPRGCSLVAQAPEALRRLQEAATNGGNVFAALMDAVRVASLGQISAAFFEVGGQYRRSV